MAEADTDQLWYCWNCDTEWDFREQKMKICPDCNAHGVLKEHV